MYLARIADKFFFVCAGTIFKSVTSACASALPHLQCRAAGMLFTASRITFCALAAFCCSVAIIVAAVTDWAGAHGFRDDLTALILRCGDEKLHERVSS